jgi:hypothetical protein
MLWAKIKSLIVLLTRLSTDRVNRPVSGTYWPDFYLLTPSGLRPNCPSLQVKMGGAGDDIDVCISILPGRKTDCFWKWCLANSQCREPFSMFREGLGWVGNVVSDTSGNENRMSHRFLSPRPASTNVVGRCRRAEMSCLFGTLIPIGVYWFGARPRYIVGLPGCYQWLPSGLISATNYLFFISHY